MNRQGEIENSLSGVMRRIIILVRQFNIKENLIQKIIHELKDYPDKTQNYYNNKMEQNQFKCKSRKEICH